MASIMEHLLGVVLCGGESKRMGSDKGLLPIANSIWANYMADKLRAFNIPVVFSIKESQADQYALHIAAAQLVTDVSNIQGPLKGLLSVHRQFAMHDILLMACDMIDLDATTISAMLSLYNNEKNYDYYVYQDASFAQPFCGIYTAAGLKKLNDQVLAGILSEYSFQHLLNSGHTKRIPVTNNTPFHNYNTLP